MPFNGAFCKNCLIALQEESDFKVFDGNNSLNQIDDILSKQKVDIIIVKVEGLKELDIIKNVIQKRKKQKVLVCGDVDRDIAFNYIKSGVKGLLNCDIPSHLLKRAIRVIHKGEVWYDRKTASMIFDELASRLTMERGQPEIVKRLSKREKEVLNLVASGYKNRDIGESLSISEKTVKTHLYHIFEKLGVEDRINASLFMRKIK